MSLGRARPGKTAGAPRSASQETWPIGGVLSSHRRSMAAAAATPARQTPEGASMRYASRRLASARRTTLVFLVSSIGFAALGTAAQRLDGTVVDQTGRPVARARVRAVTTGTSTASVFSDEAGRFSIDAPEGAACRIEAGLTGF